MVNCVRSLSMNDSPSFFFQCLIIIKLCSVVVLASRTSFNLTSFDSNSSDFVFNGDASINGNTIQLNRASARSSGSSIYREAIQLSDFATEFSFNISSTVSHGEDGQICLLLLPELDQDSSWSAYNYGGLLGLFDSNVSALNTSTRSQVVVTVKLNTGGLDPRFDIRSYNSGSSDVSAAKSGSYVKVIGGFTNKGTANVMVIYDSTAKSMSATLTFTESLDTFNVSSIGDLGDVLPEMVRVGFAASTRTDSGDIYRVLSWRFSSSLEKQSIIRRRSARKLVVIGVVVGVLFVLLVISLLCWFKKWKKIGLIDHSTILREAPAHNCTKEIGEEDDESPLNSTGFHNSTEQIDVSANNMALAKEFSYSEIQQATNNFDEETKLGEGTYGIVYRALLKDPEMFVAVKKLKGNFEQRTKEFFSEMTVISKLMHRNLVQFKGWCHHRRELLLIYEYLPGGNLKEHLFRQGFPLLSWINRYKIACGIASGVEYLHTGSTKSVIHRDIKSNNVMLERDFTAKIVDFGTARISEHGKSIQTTGEGGTRGYKPFDIAMFGGKASKESDVYSVGIVLLEIATGQSTHQVLLVPWVWHLYNADKILDSVDKRLGNEFNETQAKCLLKVALNCCHEDASRRPSMGEVKAMLNYSNSIPALPREFPSGSYYRCIMDRVQGTGIEHFTIESLNSGDARPSFALESTSLNTFDQTVLSSQDRSSREAGDIRLNFASRSTSYHTSNPHSQDNNSSSSSSSGDYFSPAEAFEPPLPPIEE